MAFLLFFNGFPIQENPCLSNFPLKMSVMRHWRASFSHTSIFAILSLAKTTFFPREICHRGGYFTFTFFKIGMLPKGIQAVAQLPKGNRCAPRA
jgi:hypothetical protein